jgi:membrane associated rhomboid family serine protease
MGFQDRDYNRYESYDDNGYRRQLGGGMSVTMKIVILNLVLWLANGFFFAENNYLTKLLTLYVPNLYRPEFWWQFLSYGFVHAPDTIWHIGGNMFCLIMFGYGMMFGIGPGGFGLIRSENVEERLGRFEYLVFYLLTIVVGGLTFALTNLGGYHAAFGASGGVCGVIVLYAWMFPKKTLYLYGILPLPMWGLGILIVVMDAYGAAGYGTQGIAFTIHLAGAAFATFYYFVFFKQRAKLTDCLTGWKLSARKKPKLRVYSEDDINRPSTAAKPKRDEEFEKRLDEILGRYGKVGEAGLTREEREFLQEASRRYRNKR